MKYNTKSKFGFAFACGLLALTTTAFSENTEPVHVTLKDFVSEDAQLLDTNGTKVSQDVLKGKFIGVYFSAHWCGPCRYFTPKLQAFRNANAEAFEVVFLSLDIDRRNKKEARSLEKKKEYMESANMNWYTIDCGYGGAYKLMKKSGRKGIPTLLIFSPEGKYVTNAGKVELRVPETAIDTWKKKAIDRK